MKALIIYFTMGGRTKQVAEIIGSVLTNFEFDYFSIELKGKFVEKIKMLDKFENKDFSAIETELKALETLDADLIIIGMPTYGNFPPKAFDEIVSRMGNLSGKKVIVFTTARFTGAKARDYMESKIKDAGGIVVDKFNFRKLFWIGKKDALKFGKKINEKKL